MSVDVISPQYLTLREWADYIVPTLEQFGNLGRLMGDDWRGFGAQMMTLPGISGSIIPDPYLFSDWQTWASRLNENLSAVP